MKGEFVKSIRYETQGRTPYHVLFNKGRGSNGPLRDGVALDPADGDPHMDTRLDHVLIDAKEYPAGLATRFFRARRTRAATCADVRTLDKVKAFFTRRYVHYIH